MFKKMISSTDISLIKRSLKYTKPYKIKFLTAFLCVISGVFLGIVQPLIWSKLLTDLFGKNYYPFLNSLILISFIFILQCLINFFQTYVFGYLSNCIVYDLKKDMYKNLLNLPVKAFDEMRIGDFISRLQSDTFIVADVLTNKFLGTIVDILKVIFIGIAVFSISIPLGLITITCFPISYLIFVKYGKILRAKNNEIMMVNDSYVSDIQQTISGIREVKSIGIKDARLKSFLRLSELFKNKSINFIKTSSLSGVLSQGINFITQVLTMAVGGYLIFKNKLTVGNFIAFTAYAAQFSISLMNITRLNSNIQQSLTSLTRIFNLMDNLSYSKQRYGNKNIKYMCGKIKFENVNFKYNDEKIILNNVSFGIPENKTIALVGPSGAGKSTIFNLLLRFYEPLDGNIKIDDINIQDLNEESLESNISIVRQDLFLFDMSIKDNLLLASPNASNEDIIEACKLANIHDYIMSLPRKYDSLIGENGSTLSSGQKQRIAIARALLKRSKIILLDEVTSSLDNVSQDYISRTINKISKNHTIVIIAHRLSTVVNADKIIVIDKGKICAQGTHETLLKESIIYRRLFENKPYKLEVI